MPKAAILSGCRFLSFFFFSMQTVASFDQANHDPPAFGMRFSKILTLFQRKKIKHACQQTFTSCLQSRLISDIGCS